MDLPYALQLWLTRMLEPLRAAAGDPLARRDVFAALGIDLATVEHELSGVQAAVEKIASAVDSLAVADTGAVSLEKLPALLHEMANAFSAVRELAASAAILDEVARDPHRLRRDLFSLLTIRYLTTYIPQAYDLAALLTLIRVPRYAEAGLPSVEPVQIPLLVSNPGTLLSGYYLGEHGLSSLQTAEQARQTADLLFPRVAALLRQFDINTHYARDPRFFLPEDPGPADRVLTLQLPIDDNAGAGVALSLRSTEEGGAGFILAPFGQLSFVSEGSSWTAEGTVHTKLPGLAFGPGGVEFPPGEPDPSLRAEIVATKKPGAQGQAFRTSATGTRLEVGQARLRGTATFDTDFIVDLVAEATSAAVVVVPGDGDSFLQKVLPRDGLRAEFDLALGWSNKRGLYLRGGAGLEAVLPVSIDLAGLVVVDSVYLALETDGADLRAAVAATAVVKLGPVTAIVEQVGLAATLRFPPEGGNLGIADLALRFKPPKGAALAVDAGVVVGGGYLYFNPDRAEYAGVLQLELSKTITLTAIGLLTTRLPGGRSGFSLLIIISAEFEPIQLGLGFKLNAVGGIFGVNRTMVLEALREGVRQRTLDSILFPKDPLARAPQIISDLQRVFPAAEGRYVFGPMVRISWGTPPILTLDLAIVLELPAPVRLAILGRLRMVLPAAEHPIIMIQVDAVGTIDFDKREASFDATLVDSRVANYPISGDMAMRLKWGENPSFVLAAGGFNPRFQPPPGFPALNRLAISLMPGDNPEVRLSGYFALTSNTVQVGARLDVYAAIDLSLLGTFSVEGYLEFDALFQLSPFHFIVDLNAAAAIKRNGRSLLVAYLHLTFSGPQPWHIEGEASFSFTFLGRHTVRIAVNATLGRREQPPALPPTDPTPELLAALADGRNWRADVPPAALRLVTLRQVRGPIGEVLVHPVGSLMVHQRVVPLETQISRFGSAPLSGPTSYQLRDVSLNGAKADWDGVLDTFARAQFVEMSDDEKLSRPSFEQFPAGVRFQIDGFEIGETFVLQSDYGYDDNLIDAGLGFSGPIEIVAAPAPRTAQRSASFQAAAVAVGQSAATPSIRFASNPPAYVIANKANLQVQATPDAPIVGATFTQVASVLQQLATQDRSKLRVLQIIGIHERVRS